MDWFFQAEVLTGLIVPSVGAIWWLANRAVQSLKDFVNERANKTDSKIDSIRVTLASHATRLDEHDEDITNLKVQAGWLRGRLGEPLEPKVKEDEQ